MSVSDPKAAATLIGTTAVHANELGNSTASPTRIVVNDCYSNSADTVHASSEPSSYDMATNWIQWRHKHPRHAWALDRIEDAGMMRKILVWGKLNHNAMEYLWQAATQIEQSLKRGPEGDRHE
jgi:hypothetical protein